MDVTSQLPEGWSQKLLSADTTSEESVVVLDVGPKASVADMMGWRH